jgi:hypothetical protein
MKKCPSASFIQRGFSQPEAFIPAKRKTGSLPCFLLMAPPLKKYSVKTESHKGCRKPPGNYKEYPSAGAH